MGFEIHCRKTVENHLVPVLQDDIETVSKMKNGEEYIVIAKTSRKYWRHKRFFALLKFMYDNFDVPTALYRGETIRQTPERHREIQLILAGYHTIDVASDGEIRYRAKSIAYNNCTEEELTNIYNNMVDRVAVMLGYIQNNPDEDTNEEHIEKLVDNWLHFAGLPPVAKKSLKEKQ